ncbi:uncharacterized protein LOC135111524 [Scylla paramamosain]|uniref:uncharacterized protein LOC135111524 n=1 Tax=Scylla paramamosain TaxID=85552 RepID=UPI003083B2B5
MHPHTHITKHMLPEFTSKIWIKACTPSNILNGFSATVILPIKRNIFSDEAFLSSQVSERSPLTPNSADEDEGVNSPAPSSSYDISDENPTVKAAVVQSERSTSTSSPSPVAPSTSRDITSESICLYPKVPAHPLGKGKKKARACILTEDEEGIFTLRAKEDRKKSRRIKQPEVATIDSNDEDEPGVTL